MRINKYIAAAGVTSRRKADELIRAGKVEVNGVRLTEPGYDVQPGDKVFVDGNRISYGGRDAYYVMNKPIGCITAVSDDRGRITVLDLMPDVEERVFPVGRLDYNTSGLLFLTSDGEFAHHIMHPSGAVNKTYRVRVAGSVSAVKLAKLRRGVDIGGFVTSRAKVDVITWNRHSTILEVTIHEGKNRQIRRMFSAVGCPVQELTRISIGNFKLGHLKPGQYRKMTRGEIEHLRSL